MYVCRYIYIYIHIHIHISEHIYVYMVSGTYPCLIQARRAARAASVKAKAAEGGVWPDAPPASQGAGPGDAAWAQALLSAWWGAAGGQRACEGGGGEAGGVRRSSYSAECLAARWNAMLCPG